MACPVTQKYASRWHHLLMNTYDLYQDYSLGEAIDIKSPEQRCTRH